MQSALARLGVGDGLSRVIMRGGAMSLAVRVFGLAIGFGAHVLLSRALGASAYGLYAIALGWCLILVVPVKFGLDQTVLRYASIYLADGRQDLLNGLMRTAAHFVVSAAAVAGLIIVGVTWVKPGVLGVANLEQAGAMALLIAALSLIGILSSFFRVKKRIFASQFYEQVLRSVLLVCGIAVFIVLGLNFSFSAALAVTAISALVALTAMYVHFRRVFLVGRKTCEPSYEKTKWFDLGGPAFAITAIQQVMAQSSIILLGWMVSSEASGQYAVAARLATFLPFGLVAVNIVTAPMISAAWHARDLEKLRQIAKINARLALCFALVLAIIFFFCGETLLLVFGDEFVTAYPALMILVMGTMLNAATGSVGFLMTMTGHHRQALTVVALALLACLIGSFVLIPQFGILGAATAAALGVVTTNVGQYLLVRSRLGIDASFLGMPVVDKG